jgi:hypothetical protein
MVAMPLSNVCSLNTLCPRVFSLICSGQDFSRRDKNWTKIELWFFGTALHINALLHCVQFKQIFQVMITKQMYRHTKRRLYALYLGRIKIKMIEGL